MTDKPLDRTQALPTEAILLNRQAAAAAEFRTGVAAVPSQRAAEPVYQYDPAPPPGQVLTSGSLKKPEVSLKVRVRTLRRGGKWSVTGAAVLLVCWGLWAGAGQAGIQHTALVLFGILAVGVGLFGVLRLVGATVWEKMLGRTRRGAVGSHLAVGLFLVLAGVQLLRATEWVASILSGL